MSCFYYLISKIVSNLFSIINFTINCDANFAFNLLLRLARLWLWTFREAVKPLFRWLDLVMILIYFFLHTVPSRSLRRIKCYVCAKPLRRVKHFMILNMYTRWNSSLVFIHKWNSNKFILRKRYILYANSLEVIVFQKCLPGYKYILIEK